MSKLVIAAAAALLPTFSMTAQDRDLIEVATAAGSFKTLAAALEAAGLVDALRGDGPFTVFAPTDEAFAKLPKGTLESLLRPENKQRLVSILGFHVVAGRVSAVQALQAAQAPTLQKSTLRFTLDKGQLLVNGKRVVQNDIAASNGVIHVIDEVLIPQPPRPKYRPLSGVEFIKLAIEKGVPLFNDGKHDACAAIYEVALRGLLDLDDELLSKETREKLMTASLRAAGQDHPRLRSWTLRYAIDMAWRELENEAGPTSTASTDTRSEADPSTREVFAFAGDEPVWRSVNDDVMGGVSRGGFRLTKSGTGIFSGALSLENNGGFSTVRSGGKDLDLAGFDGVILRVRGDGRRYTFSALRNDRRFEPRTWQTRFDTKADEWTTVKIPFDELRMRVYGRWVRGTDGISGGDVRSFSIGISDKNEDPFRLEIDSIQAYREAK